VRRIAIVVHPNRDVHRTVRSLHAWAAERAIDVIQLRTHADEAGHAPEGDIDGAELIVAIGGDGTVLAALRAAAHAGLPVLGVACGSLGALSTVAGDEVEMALDCFEAGDWTPHRIPALEIDAPDAASATALNDLVVVRAGGGQIATSIDVDGEHYASFAGDGVIVSTQLGSSAYALASGGPVIAPSSDAWLVTPLAAHGGCIPPLVVAAAARVRLAIGGGYYGARVEVDGQPTDFPASELELDVTRRADFATLVRVGEEESYLAGLRRRKIIIDSPRMLVRDARTLASAAVPPGPDPGSDSRNRPG
jgi:NAD+ kinase